ncbi:MAG: hypothetical protein GXO07_01380 [Crenarchaeota archaeon]|nr:hypothetical protein [Thermoproteota archaeon]
MAEEKASKLKLDKTKLIIAASVAIAVIAVAAIALTTMGAPKQVKVAEMKAAPKEGYVLDFFELRGIRSAIPLTYPDPNGIVFISVTTLNNTNEIWTYQGNELVGTYKVNGTTVVPVFDMRKGEYATYKGKLLLGIDGALYAIYGSEAEELGRYDFVADSNVGIFVLKDSVYAWVVKVNRGNYTTAYCTLYDILKGESLANYTFDLGVNVTAVSPLPDMLDGRGCLVLWTKRSQNAPLLYYEYKGREAEASGALNLMNMQITTFVPIFFEVESYKSKPFFMYVTPNPDGTFTLKLQDIIDNTTKEFPLPGLYNFINAGDYMGKGYVGDALFLVITRTQEGDTRYTMEIYNVHGEMQEVPVGKLSTSLAVFNGMSFAPENKRVFGLGNYTNAYVSITTNAGKLEFQVRNVPQNVSSLFMVGSIENQRLCYTAIVNPTVGGLASPQQFVEGKVYLAVGCSG